MPQERAAKPLKLLLERCPEFTAALETSRSIWEGEEYPDGVGIYILRDDINAYLEWIVPYVCTDPQHNLRHWQWFLEDFPTRTGWGEIAAFSELQLADLTQRLFVVFEQWAATPDPYVRQAVEVELIIDGQIPLEDLARMAGPATSNLTTQAVGVVTVPAMVAVAQSSPRSVLRSTQVSGES